MIMMILIVNDNNCVNPSISVAFVDFDSVRSATETDVENQTCKRSDRAELRCSFIDGNI